MFLKNDNNNVEIFYLLGSLSKINVTRKLVRSKQTMFYYIKKKTELNNTK